MKEIKKAILVKKDEKQNKGDSVKTKNNTGSPAECNFW